MAYSVDEVPPGFSFRVPFDARVSERDVRRATALWIASQQRKVARRQAQVKKLAGQIERRRKTLRAAVGAEAFFALSQFKRQIRLEAARKRSPPHGLGISQDQLVRKQTKRIETFLEKRGVKPAKLRAAVDGLAAKISFPFTDVVGTFDGGVIAPDDPGPDTFRTFTPPFDGFVRGITETDVGFRVEHKNLLNGDVGQIGTIITLDDEDAGDFDSGSVSKDSQVAVWFQAPVTGFVEVLLDVQCSRARHELRAQDEWGFSDSATSQRILFMMEALHDNVPEPTFILVSEISHSGADGAFFDVQNVAPGANLRTQSLISLGAIPKGQMVLVTAGVKSEDSSFSNDVTIHSKSTSAWIIKRMHVRIAP